MKILSIDTASNICGVSILENDKLICNLDKDTGRTHSENLMPMIDEIFNKTNLTINDINLIICNIGPGSFTGIRIGVATTKAFSDSLNIPCIGVNSLESLAYNEKPNLNNGDIIFSIIDCKNENCYYSVYEFNDNQYKEIFPPKSDSINNLKILEKELNNKKIVFVGDGVEVYKNQLSSIFSKAIFSKNNFLNSYNLGLCGFDKYNNKDFNEVMPLYLNKPQAQRQLEAKQLLSNSI